ncbi:MAG: hypothetical protein J6A94_08520 [Lachnospiraceae bacterium]|nr:hypothetical protein [Lachnospiraceae bacterium]
MRRMNVFSIVTDSLEDFRNMAVKAKEMGATHIMAADMPRSRWMWEQDLSDPYPNWSMGHAQIFKLVCPPELKEFLPQEHIEECFELLKARCDILKEVGLKPALFSNEPFWLPEEVYRAHPAWRGARCDHPRRSRKPYYSPCIDNPEVLAMYKHAVKVLCQETGIDYINFMSNDSGGGLCWSTGTYVGPNGPESCRERSMADRVAGFVDALTEGAAEAGVDMVVHFCSEIDFKAKEISVSTACPKLKDNQIVNKMNNKSEVVVTSIIDVGVPGKPVKKIPHMVKFVKFAMKAAALDTPIVMRDIPRSDLDEAWEVFAQIKKQNPTGIDECFKVLKDAAVNIVGEEAAGRLVDVWYQIDEAYNHLSHTGLDLVMYGCQHQRWINRPFVLFPMELAEEDRAYYRKFQFQALTEENTNDLMNLQGIEGVRGFTATFMLGETMKKAIASLELAIAGIESIQEILKDEEKCSKLTLMKKRLLAERCFYRNIIHAARFQELVDRTDFENQPTCELRWPTRNDSRIEEFQNITRAEIDNTYELIDILEGNLEEIILCTTPEKEDIFLYSTEFINQLKRKAEIMLEHMNDGIRVYETHNI